MIELPKELLNIKPIKKSSNFNRASLRGLTHRNWIQKDGTRVPRKDISNYDSQHKRWRMAKKLSEAYANNLAARVPDNILRALDIWDPDVESKLTWADLLAQRVLARAVGQVANDKICFTAITELRETTEGRNVDKPTIGNANSELLALASAIAAGPVVPETPEGDSQTDD